MMILKVIARPIAILTLAWALSIGGVSPSRIP